MLFTAEKLAYRPRVIFMVLLFCPVSCWTKPNTLQIHVAEEIFRQHTIWESTIWLWESTGSFWNTCTAPLHTGSKNYGSIRITWRWRNFHWNKFHEWRLNRKIGEIYGPRNISTLWYLATYTCATILKEDRDTCVADTSKANNSYYTSYPSPAGVVVITRVECAWKMANSGLKLFADRSSVHGNGRRNAVPPRNTTSKAEATSSTQKQEVCSAA